MERIPDKAVQKKVDDNLMRSGSHKIKGAVRSGTVTLTGVLQYEMQRNAMVKAASSAPGVLRVVDQMTVFVRPRMV
jgi:osmotically-inducible protein OsmY